MEVKINKEIRDYQEGLFFGLTMRQCIFSVLAIGAAVGTYFLLKQVTDRDMGWLCVLAALPFALCGFFRYNGMTAERFAIALIHHYLTPPRLLFRCENVLAKLMRRYEHD